jgi:hypothetical protein
MSEPNASLPPVRVCYTEIELCGWLGQAAPGDILQYHRGFLAIDREPQHARMAKTDRDELIRMCRRAHWAAECGLAHLLQRRHGDGDYSYLLIARPRPATMSATLLAQLGDEVGVMTRQIPR